MFTIISQSKNKENSEQYYDSYFENMWYYKNRSTL